MTQDLSMGGSPQRFYLILNQPKKLKNQSFLGPQITVSGGKFIHIN